MKFMFKAIAAKTISLTTLSVLAYDNTRYDTGVDITKKGLEVIKKITIQVMAGDEIAIIEYKDGHTERYDASLVGGARSGDMLDDKYVLYKEGDDESTILMWLFRSDSDDRRWAEHAPTYKTLRP